MRDQVSIASITINVDWAAQEWRLDCMRCDWGHVINATHPSLGAIVELSEDHLDEEHRTRLDVGAK